MIALIITPFWFFFTLICVVAILWFRGRVKQWDEEEKKQIKEHNEYLKANDAERIRILYRQWRRS